MIYLPDQMGSSAKLLVDGQVARGDLHAHAGNHRDALAREAGLCHGRTGEEEGYLMRTIG